MSNNAVSKKTFYAILILCVAALVALTASVYVYIQQNAQLQEKQQQILNLQSGQAASPQLVSIDLKCSFDQTTSKLRVTGYVVNVGGARANNCTVHVNTAADGSQSGNDLSAMIEPIEAGAYRQVNVEFPFSGSGVLAFNTYLKWTN